MADYSSSSTVLIADVDCIGSGKDLCTKHGVQGFPTLKFGDPSNLEDYKGGRDAAILKSFASELKPSCNVVSLENCDSSTIELIVELKEKKKNELEELVVNEEKERQKVEKTFEDNVNELQSQYKDLTDGKQAKLKEIEKEYHIGIVQSILSQRKETSKEEL